MMLPMKHETENEMYAWNSLWRLKHDADPDITKILAALRRFWQEDMATASVRRAALLEAAEYVRQLAEKAHADDYDGATSTCVYVAGELRKLADRPTK